MKIITTAVLLDRWGHLGAWYSRFSHFHRGHDLSHASVGVRSVAVTLVSRACLSASPGSSRCIEVERRYLRAKKLRVSLPLDWLSLRTSVFNWNGDVRRRSCIWLVLRLICSRVSSHSLTHQIQFSSWNSVATWLLYIEIPFDVFEWRIHLDLVSSDLICWCTILMVH